MASIIDSIRSVYQDNYSLIKLAAFSGVMFFLYSLIVPSKSFNMMNFIMFLIITYIYLGFVGIIMSNRINQRIETLPTLNIIHFAAVATKAFIILIPFGLIGAFAVNFVVGLFQFEGLPQQIAIWIIRFIIFSVFITSMINFTEKYEISEAFNIPKILNGIADVLVYTLICTLLMAILGGLIVFPTLFLIHQFFEFNPLFVYVATFFITIGLAIYADYWGQLHFDIESKNNYY